MSGGKLSGTERGLMSGGKPSGRSVMLQKKLQELETELAAVFRRPLDTTTSDPNSEEPLDDVKQRFSFLGKLLAAEVDSQPQISDQLQEIDQRLTQLKAAFRDWSKSRSCFFNNPDDTLSICSDCTQLLLFDGSGGELGSEAESEEDEEEFPGEKPPEKLLQTDGRERGERLWSEMGKYCGAFGCGVIVGALIVSMVVLIIFAYDDLIEYYDASFILLPRNSKILSA